MTTVYLIVAAGRHHLARLGAVRWPEANGRTLEDDDPFRAVWVDRETGGVICRADDADVISVLEEDPGETRDPATPESSSDDWLPLHTILEFFYDKDPEVRHTRTLMAVARDSLPSHYAKLPNRWRIRK